jgi:hypothetical protein
VDEINITLLTFKRNFYVLWSCRLKRELNSDLQKTSTVQFYLVENVHMAFIRQFTTAGATEHGYPELSVNYSVPFLVHKEHHLLIGSGCDRQKT